MTQSEKKDFIGYEYKEITVKPAQVPQYLDCYENFGWEGDERAEMPELVRKGKTVVQIRLKRNRKIVNKAELTRLQRHFEACAAEIEVLEAARSTKPTILSIVVGLIGTAFLAGATFAATHEPPVVWLCILLAIPGFTGWILPYFVYQNRLSAQTKKLQPMIESKQEEIYGICEKGHALL